MIDDGCQHVCYVLKIIPSELQALGPAPPSRDNAFVFRANDGILSLTT
jgi:hypothetical protein